MEGSMRIAIIGAGWYGCHAALELKKRGYEVVIFEKSPQIFSGISGTFGIRLHVGPHYPRSKGTREYCQANFLKFKAHYPELVNQHEYSIYAMGDIDSDGKPSKVNAETFDVVCQEFNHKSQIKPEDYGHTNLVTAHDLEEPSMTLGDPLRHFFQNKLAQAEIEIRYNFEVNDIAYDNKNVVIDNQQFDYVVNASSFKAHVPPTLPRGLSHVYQPCLALVYKDKHPSSDKPISFIAMDGWFPCLMPYLDGDHNKYIMTHGKWTILDSCLEHSDAQEVLNDVDDHFVNTYLRPRCEKEMSRFFPSFKERFEYQEFKGSIIAKPVTNTEFRSAITFYEKDKKMIHIIPGKVSCIFSAFEELLLIIKQHNLVTDIGNQNIQYPQNGVLALYHDELDEQVQSQDRNTCHLKTYSIFKDVTNTSHKHQSNAKALPDTLASKFRTIDNGLSISEADKFKLLPRIYH